MSHFLINKTNLKKHWKILVLQNVLILFYRTILSFVCRTVCKTHDAPFTMFDDMDASINYRKGSSGSRFLEDVVLTMLVSRCFKFRRQYGTFQNRALFRSHTTTERKTPFFLHNIWRPIGLPTCSFWELFSGKIEIYTQERLANVMIVKPAASRQRLSVLNLILYKLFIFYFTFNCDHYFRQLARRSQSRSPWHC